MGLELRQELSSMSGKPCFYCLIFTSDGSLSLAIFVCMCILVQEIMFILSPALLPEGRH